MKKTRDGRRRFSREFKVAAVRRVMEGEQVGVVARDLGISFRALWGWKKRVVEKGEEYLHELGRPKQWQRARPAEPPDDGAQKRRMAELERVVGRQQMEIRFLAKALRQVEERRQQKKNAGGVASSKR
ncbi:MAG TPA: transposase [Pseudolabrys sp.]|nr:transposase [Pseudolabrys sp.]